MFETLFRLSQDELYDVLINELKKAGYTDIKYQGERKYIAAHGSIPVLLIAHLDTVFEEEHKHYEKIQIFHDKEKGVMWSPDGLGADDRAGVAMILALLDNTNLRPHIIFTTNEETDADGAITVAKSQPFKDISFIIELDRQGFNDAVYYKCANQEFEFFIDNFGFDTAYGTFTDISIICPAWGIAGVNLSVGYYMEHTYLEHFSVKAWVETYKKVKKILETKHEKTWEYIEKEN